MGCLFTLCQKHPPKPTTFQDDDFKEENSLFRNSTITFITEGGNHLSEEPVTTSDFQKLKLLGRGSFGEVFLVRHIGNKRLFAMKILRKKILKLKNQEINTRTERLMLEKINHQNIVNLFYAFQDSTKLYLLTEFIQGGELFYHLYSSKTFEPQRAKFYAAQIVLAFEYLHSNNCIYRDLKPENILIDKDGYIKLTDFGLSKMLLENKENKTYTICGTPEYLAPEILLNKGYDKTVDWWSLGTLLFNMLNGRRPLKINKNAISIDQYYQPIKFTSHCPEDAKAFLRQLLVIDPSKRLGYGPEGTMRIKEDEYFKDIDWEALMEKKVNAPFVPQLTGEEDLRYFDYGFTSEQIKETYIDKIGIGNGNNNEEDEDMYAGFSYVKQKIFEEDETSISDDLGLVTEKEG